MANGSELDEEGFLKDPDLWTEDLSRKMAIQEFDITLTDLHLNIIHFMRSYYQKWGTLPTLKGVRNEFNLDASRIDELFRRGTSTARGVICKLAGLPKILCIASGC